MCRTLRINVFGFGRKPVKLNAKEKFLARILGLKIMKGRAQHRAVVILESKKIGTALLWA
jgi:hypothetical protein